MKIETFKGRKGKYNVAILKALYNKGYLKAWELAKTIVENDPLRAKSNWYHETQKVNSVLVRKCGTLERLLKKEFIKKSDEGYNLTIFKGFCTALTLFIKMEEPAIDEWASSYEIFPELKRVHDILFREHPDSKIEFYEEMAKITNDLLNQGWNIDSVSNKRFNTIFNEYYNEYLLCLVKEKQKTDKKWNPSPELQEALSDFLDRILQTTLKAAKELENEIEIVKKSMETKGNASKK